MLKYVQKIVLNGTSAQVTIPRPLLNKLDLRPGNLVQVQETEEGEIHIRPLLLPDTRGVRPPGRIADDAPAVPK